MGTDETGLLFQVRLPQPLRSATLSYKYKFSSGYDWTSGGKLPGLCDEGAVLAREDLLLYTLSRFYSFWCTYSRLSRNVKRCELLYFSGREY